MADLGNNGSIRHRAKREVVARALGAAPPPLPALERPTLDRRAKTGANPIPERHGDDIAARATIDAAIGAGNLSAAAVVTRELLGRLPPPHHEIAYVATRLIDAYESALEGLPPLAQVARHKVHFDDRVVICFEQLVALLRQQDAQIAELHAILADLV